MLPATIEKNQAFTRQGNSLYGSFRLSIIMSKCETKDIETDLGTFRGN